MLSMLLGHWAGRCYLCYWVTELGLSEMFLMLYCNSHCLVVNKTQSSLITSSFFCAFISHSSADSASADRCCNQSSDRRCDHSCFKLAVFLDVLGSFEIALLRFCRVFNLENNSVLLGSNFVPFEVLKAISKWNFHVTKFYIPLIWFNETSCRFGKYRVL